MSKWAVILFMGYTQPSRRSAGAGLWLLSDRIATMLPSRTTAYLTVQTWNCDAAALADEVHDWGPDYVATVQYSYGAGVAGKAFAERMAHNLRHIKVGYYIDPVTYADSWLGKLKLSMIQSSAPFPVGSIVDETQCFVTRNQRRWKGIVPTDPWGRQLRHKRTTFNMIFDGEADLTLREDLAIYPDRSVHHDSIDNDVRVHNHIVHDLGQRIGREAA